MKIDDAAFEEIRLAVETEADPAFWHSRTPEERVVAMELMRRRAYGYDEHSMPRLQRVIEIVDLKRYQGQPESVASQSPPRDPS